MYISVYVYFCCVSISIIIICMYLTPVLLNLVDHRVYFADLSNFPIFLTTFFELSVFATFFIVTYIFLLYILVLMACCKQVIRSRSVVCVAFAQIVQKNKIFQTFFGCITFWNLDI